MRGGAGLSIGVIVGPPTLRTRYGRPALRNESATGRQPAPVYVRQTRSPGSVTTRPNEEVNPPARQPARSERGAGRLSTIPTTRFTEVRCDPTNDPTLRRHRAHARDRRRLLAV